MITTKEFVTSEWRVAITMMSDEKEKNMVMPANWVPGPRQGEWTYEMYSALPDDGHHYEVMQGVLMMSPAPEMAHQGIVGLIYRYLSDHIFLVRRGLVFTGPADVVLFPKKIVQPDVLVLLKNHMDQLKEKYIEGAPDLVVEIISPGSVTYGRLIKHSLYEQSGIPEYWLVNPEEQSIEVFVLEMGKYHSLGEFRHEQIVQSRLVPNETVQATWFFDWTGGMHKAN